MGIIFLFGIIVISGVEIAVFVEVGDQIGLWPTLSAVFLTAVAGVALLRQQGLAILQRAMKNLERGRFPVSEVFDGLCLLMAGAFLLVPGFVTDGAGLLLFFPPIRASLGRFIQRHLAKSERPGTGGGKTNHSWTDVSDIESIIDGDYQDITSADGDLKKDANNDDTKPSLPLHR